MTVSLLIASLAAAFLVYGPLPELWLRGFGLGAAYRGDDLVQELAFTFDDGPDPDYTPALLDLLDRHGAKAVFFVVGKQARKNPELLREIRRRGHEIGNHTANHVNSWFVSPVRLRREILATSAAVEAATGEPTRYFRPPWGRLNLFSLAVARRTGHEIVLWTFDAGDWKPGDRAGEVAAAITERIQNGAIVLLHDFGRAPGVPENTLCALEALLPKLDQLDFACTVTPVTRPLHIGLFGSGKRSQREKLAHAILLVWERLFNRMYGVYPMTRIFRMGHGHWHFGERLTDALPTPADEAATQVAATREPILADGLPMIELHLQNRALREFAELGTPEKIAVRSLKVARDSLHRLARIVAVDDRWRQARGVFGISIMHKGMERLGFHVEPVEDTFGNRWTTFLLRGILTLGHPLGRERLRHGRGDLAPRLMWMTRETLLARYLSGESQDPSPSPTAAETADAIRRDPHRYEKPS